MSLQPTISSTAIADILPIMYRARRVPYFVGRPGIAKTAMVREGANEISRLIGGTPVPVHELHLASMSEVDVRGYLIPNGDQAQFTKPEFWAAVERNPQAGILFLDEFPQATHEVQKAVAPLLLDRRVGDYVLPPGWMVVCAGNGTEDSAGANSLLSHVLNRITYIPVDAPETMDWVSWAASNGLPHELCALAQLRPDVVFQSPVPDVADTPYCTPRSIHTLGDIANAYPGGLTEMVANPMGMSLVNGAIGAGAGAELAGLIRTTLRLPSFDAVMAAPETAPVPSNLDEQYAMVMLVAVRAKGDEHFESAAQYLVRFPVNIALTGIVSLVRRDHKFMHSRTFGKWCADNRALVTKFQKYIKVV